MNKYSPYPGDEVPAVLEKGEYVLNRNAVNAIGKDRLDRVNHEEHPRYMNKGGGVSPFGEQAPMVSIPPNMNVPQSLQQKALILANKYRHLVMPKAVKAEYDDLMKQARDISYNPNYNPNPMPDYHQQNVDRRTRSNASIARQNQQAMDHKVVEEGVLRNKIDQAVNLSRGKQTLDLARTKLRDIEANNANTKSIFDEMHTSTIGTWDNFMKDSPMPRAPGQFDPIQMRQAEMAAQNMTSSDLKYTDNVLLREAISNDPRLSRIIQRNDDRADYAVDKKTQHIKDTEASVQRSKDWAANRKLEMSKAPKMTYKFGGGMTEEQMRKSIKRAVEDNDYSSLQGFAQGFQGSDSIDDGYGLYSLLNMNVLAKEAGVPEEELKTITAMGDQARVDKANRGHGPATQTYAEEKKPSTLDKIKASMGSIGRGLYQSKRSRALADEMSGKLGNVEPEYKDIPDPVRKKKEFNKVIAIKPVTGTDRNAPTKVNIGPNLPGSIDPLQFADQKADLMKRKGMSLPPNLMQEGGEAKKPGLLSKFVQGAQDWAGQDWGKRYEVDEEANAEKLKMQESENTLSEMEGWGDIPEEQQSSLIKQRALGLAQNNMYGEQDDDWDTPDEDKINPADDTALNTMAIKQTAGKLGMDALKGTAYGAAGLAAVAPAGIAGGLYGLYKGNELMREGKTDFDTFKETGEGSGWQKVGGMLAKAGQIGRSMNEDSPFASMMGDMGGPKKSPKKTSTAKFKGGDDSTLPGYEAETPQAVANSVADAKKSLNTITDPLNQDLNTDGVTKQEDAPIFDDKNPDMVKERQAMLKKAGIDIGTTGEGGDGVDGEWGPKSQAAWDELNAMKESGYMTEDADGKQVYQFGHDYTPQSEEEVFETPYHGVTQKYQKQGGGFISGIMRYQNGGQV